MPHLIIEYSRPADKAMQATQKTAQKAKMQSLCDALFHMLAKHRHIPDPRSLKIRAHPCDTFKTGHVNDSFAHAHLALLAGRDAKTKADLAACILACLQEHLPEFGSLSVDISDLGPTYTKRIL